jgi:carbamoylphosphate synthase large subunit
MNILVTGIGGPSGKATSRYLKDHHLVVGADLNDSADTSSVERFYAVPPGESPDFIFKVVDIIQGERIRLLIPTVDEELANLSENRSLLDQLGVTVFISPELTIATCRDKYLFACRLAQEGIPTPNTCLPSEFKESRLTPPYLIKPRVGRGSRGIQILESPHEVEALGLEDSFIIQDFASGPDYVGMCFMEDGQISEPRLLKKTEREHGDYGSAVSTTQVHDEDVLELMKTVLSSMEFDGPIDVDFRRDAGGRPLVLEVNPRIGANICKVPEILTTMIRKADVHWK